MIRLDPQIGRKSLKLSEPILQRRPRNDHQMRTGNSDLYKMRDERNDLTSLTKTHFLTHLSADVIRSRIYKELTSASTPPYVDTGLLSRVPVTIWR